MRHAQAQGFLGLLQRAYYASQGWLAVIVVGILGGIISAFVDISTAFTTDLKLGFCRPWFWAPKTECCYGIRAFCFLALNSVAIQRDTIGPFESSDDPLIYFSFSPA